MRKIVGSRCRTAVRVVVRVNRRSAVDLAWGTDGRVHVLLLLRAIVVQDGVAIRVLSCEAATGSGRAVSGVVVRRRGGREERVIKHDALALELVLVERRDIVIVEVVVVTAAGELLAEEVADQRGQNDNSKECAGDDADYDASGRCAI